MPLAGYYLILFSDQVYQMGQVARGTAAMLVGTMPREETSQVMRDLKDDHSSLRLVYVTPEKIIKV